MRSLPMILLGMLGGESKDDTASLYDCVFLYPLTFSIQSELSDTVLLFIVSIREHNIVNVQSQSPQATAVYTLVSNNVSQPTANMHSQFN